MTEEFTGTYAQYVAECQKRQRRYIMEQRAKMRSAQHAWRRYEETMRGMGLHSLTPREIYDRQQELERMLTDIPISHGDSPTMRMCYETRMANKEEK